MSRRVTKDMLLERIATLQRFGTYDFVVVKPSLEIALKERIAFIPVCQYAAYLPVRQYEIGMIGTTRYFTET